MHKHNPTAHGKKEDKHTAKKAELSGEEFEKLQKKVRELEELKEKFLRGAADFENAKKRLTREKDDFVKFSQERILLGLLPILDNFTRALDHAEQSKTDEGSEKQLEGLISGIRMVEKQLLDTLKRFGLVRFESSGKHFDPHRHEAIGHVAEEGKEDEVVEEVEPGYMLHDKLLRAAKVRVRIRPKTEN